MKTVHCFLGVDMRKGPVGLGLYAKKKGIDLRLMNQGEAAVFINRAKDKMKAYSYNGVVSYIAFSDKNRKIDLNALEYFPKAFDPAGVMNYGAAIKLSLEKMLEKKGKFNGEVLTKGIIIERAGTGSATTR